MVSINIVAKMICSGECGKTEMNEEESNPLEKLCVAAADNDLDSAKAILAANPNVLKPGKDRLRSGETLHFPENLKKI